MCAVCFTDTQKTLVKMQILCIDHISQRQINNQHLQGATRVLTFITQFHLELLINSTVKSHNILFYLLSKLSQKILTTCKFNTDGECAEKKQYSCFQWKELRTNVNILFLDMYAPIVQKKQEL